jgi:16S rRNA (guanine527-N7)-methyltransferase
VSDRDFCRHLSSAAAAAGVRLSAEALDRLCAYWRLLAKWNRTINLTALPLDPVSDAALMRLFVEPLVAARYLPETGGPWYDLGSGGGSPAIPIKIARPEITLVLVESRGRKAAFLREVARDLTLPEIEVFEGRVETVAGERQRTAELVTARAVRPDRSLIDAIRTLLHSRGSLLLFQSASKPLKLSGLSPVEQWALNDQRTSWLVRYVPRGTDHD